MVKQKILLMALLLLGCSIMCGCTKKDALMNCQIYWQLYYQPKSITPDQIENTFKETFTGFYQKVNDNTVLARETTRSDVRSNTLQLCRMADAKLDEPLDPTLNETVEVRVFINFGTYVEEVWSKEYR